MDGYAVQSANLTKAPVSLDIIEDIKAGDMPAKTVQPGQCARIMTGAPLPQGADSVIPSRTRRRYQKAKFKSICQ